MDFDITEQKPPYSIEAEQAILGSIFLNPNAIDKAVLVLKPEHFYSQKHSQIFETMTEMKNFDMPIELVLVLERLREKGLFTESSDKEYLFSLAEASSMINEITYYINIVREKAILREVIDVCKEVGSMCYQNEDATDVLDVAERKIYGITNNRQNTSLFRLSDIVEDELKRLSDQRSDPEKYLPVKVGISSFDNFVGGINNSDLVIVAARPGVGKSTFALNVAYNIAKSSAYEPKKSVVFFSLEMSKEQLARKIMSKELLIDSDTLRLGRLTDENWTDLYNFWYKDLQNINMYFDDTPNITAIEMKSKLRRIKNLGLIVIDYLQLMNSSKHIENRVNEIGEITRSIKIMAKEFNVPIMLLSQLSRSVEQRKDDNKTPRLSDLRDSGSIEQDADVVIFLSRPEYYDKETDRKNICEIIVEKNRHGQTGKVTVAWDGAHSAYRSIEMGSF